MNDPFCDGKRYCALFSRHIRILRIIVLAILLLISLSGRAVADDSLGHENDVAVPTSHAEHSTARDEETRKDAGDFDLMDDRSTDSTTRSYEEEGYSDESSVRTANDANDHTTDMEVDLTGELRTSSVQATDSTTDEPPNETPPRPRASVLDKLSVLEGVYQLASLHHFQLVLDQQQQQQKLEKGENHTLFWVVLLYNNECAISPTLLTLIQGAAALSAEHDVEIPIDYGRVLVDASDRGVLNKVFGIEATPTIVLVSADATASFLVEYTGRASTAREVQLGAQYYFDTLSLTAQPQSMKSSTSEETKEHRHPLLTVQPRRFDGMASLQAFLIRYARRLFETVDHSTLRPAHPVLSMHETTRAERTYIHWLFMGSDDSFRPSTVVLVQCRHAVGHATRRRLYDEFDQMARSLQGRRDRLFFVIQSKDTEPSCGMDGRVDAYEIPVEEGWLDSLTEPTEHWSELYTHFAYTTLEETETASDATAPLSRLVEFLMKACTDTVLWFDRQTVAPIVFSSFRKVHAVLIVDLHHSILAAAANGDASSLETHPMARINQRAVLHFRHVCHAYRRASAGSILDPSHMACLVLPSTETRVLTTFGLMDTWSNADQAFVQAVASGGRATDDSVNDTTPTLVFPSVLITDQRFGGTLRYYQNLNSAEDEIEDVMDQFIAGYRNEELPFAVKSSKLGARTNEAGVRIVTTDTVDVELFKDATDDPSHSLILFVAPTCGHCKRFMVLWNRLSLLLKHIGWDSLLQLYQMDVSENDVTATSLHIEIEWLPDVYYVAPASRHLVRYNVTDELGDGVGAIRDTREILEWLIQDLDIFSPQQMQQLLSLL